MVVQAAVPPAEFVDPSQEGLVVLRVARFVFAPKNWSLSVVDGQRNIGPCRCFRAAVGQHVQFAVVKDEGQVGPCAFVSRVGSHPVLLAFGGARAEAVLHLDTETVVGTVKDDGVALAGGVAVLAVQVGKNGAVLADL